MPFGVKICKKYLCEVLNRHLHNVSEREAHMGPFTWIIISLLLYDIISLGFLFYAVSKAEPIPHEYFNRLLNISKEQLN